MQQPLYFMKSAVRLVLSACISLSSQLGISEAQVVARASHAPLPLQAATELTYRSLRDVLTELKGQYQVSILFESRVVENLTVPSENVLAEKSVESALDKLLKPFGLNYRRVKERAYIVIEERYSRKPPTNLPAIATPGANRPNSSDPATQPLIPAADVATPASPKEQPVRGTVNDSNGQGLPGVSVVVKGSTRGTTTDAKGNYQLDVPGTTTVLVFSFIGFETKEVLVGQQSLLNLSLTPSNQALSEVVVVGYGTQRKADLTSAVASVKSENFVKGYTKDIGQLLQGKVAGLSVSSPSGDPTAESQILLRGITTLKAGASPLILIDGIPGSLNTVAPEDVESVDILKDGSAAAIYGTRGTNGVILITTRRASGQAKMSVDYSGYLSTESILRKPDLLNADEFRNLIKQGEPRNDFGASTDWFKAVTRTPVSHVHNLTVRGGTGQTNYLANVNYRGLQGIFLNSDRDVLNTRLDINHTMLDGRIKANFNMINTANRYTTTVDGSALSGNSYAGTSFGGGTFRQVLIANPTQPIRDAQGNWVEQPALYANPVALLTEGVGENKSQNTRLNAVVTYEPVDGLQFRALLAQTRFNETRGYAETKQHISAVANGRNGYASRGTTASLSNLMELTANYSRTYGDHNFSLLGGYGYQSEELETYWMQNWDFPTDKFSYNNIGAGRALLNGFAPIYSNKNSYNLISFFSRATYSYQSKYLLSASVRYEGSSKFIGSSKPWGTFPALSLGWRINREAFMRGVSWVDDLKLRVGYGVTGTAPSDFYLALPRLSYSGYTYSNGQWVPQLLPSSNPNPNLRWEQKTEINAGLDFSLVKGRLNGSVDVYSRRTNGLLWDFRVPIPPNVYEFTTANVGIINNKGLEVLINYTPIRKATIEWTSSVNFSTNANRLVSLSNNEYQSTAPYFYTGYTGEPVQTTTHRVDIGGPIGNFYGYKVVDVTDQGKWIYAGADGKTTTEKKVENKQVLGNGLPKYYAGWNNTVRFKNVDLSVTMRGAFDYQILNFQRMYYEGSLNKGRNALKSAYDKVFGKAVLTDDLEYTSYYIENGDFWKIDNLTLGYTFRGLSGKVLRGARVYVSSLNTALFTGYKGIDPEVNRSGLAPGNDDRDKYPTTRSLTFGLNLNL